jgi:hypothetical protein
MSDTQNLNNAADGGLPRTPCSAFAALRDEAMNIRQNAIERGLEEKERYCRGILDGLRAAEKLCSWRDPKTDPPTSTGKILVWVDDRGPAIVNVEESWMCFWDGHDETEPTDPHEWKAWREIYSPNEKSPSTGATGNDHE